MGGSEERTILRIRCRAELFRCFKRIAADYDDYEDALEMLIDGYQRYLKTFPNFPKTKYLGRESRYKVTG